MDRKPGYLARLGARLFPYRLLAAMPAVVLGALLVQPTHLPPDVRLPLWGGSALLVLAGLALRAWAAGCAGHHTRKSAIQAPKLATDGPYAYVRNPIYLGSILLGVGMVGLVGDLRLLPLAAVVFAGLYATLIPAEEAFLSRQFGEEYARYRQAVPRLLPRFRPWSGAAPSTFGWSGLRRELSLLVCLAVILGVVAGAAHLRAHAATTARPDLASRSR